MSYTSGDRAFFDTNVLLYMHGSDESKRLRAVELYEQYTRSERLVISTQVVQEFYAAGSRKLAMNRGVLIGVVEAFLRWPLVTLGPEEILFALDIEERYKVSFWDALILAAAESGGAETLFTEDLSHGQRYGTVTVCNPFRAVH
jgi:predicted nucleic acid-binding protein